MIFEAILNRTPVAAVRLNPSITAELERIIEKSLEKEQDLRYQHASEMCADLKRLKRGSGSQQVAVAPEPAVMPRANSRRGIFVSVAILVLLLAFSYAGMRWHAMRENAATPVASKLSIAVLPLQISAVTRPMIISATE